MAFKNSPKSRFPPTVEPSQNAIDSHVIKRAEKGMRKKKMKPLNSGIHPLYFVLIVICLIEFCGCRTQALSVKLANNVQLDGVSRSDVDFVLATLKSQKQCLVESPVKSIARGTRTNGEVMIAYTETSFFEFSLGANGTWRLIHCGPYIGDTFWK